MFDIFVVLFIVFLWCKDFGVIWEEYCLFWLEKLIFDNKDELGSKKYKNEEKK